MTAMSLDQAIRHVTTTNPAFAVETVQIRGVDYRVFANVPASIPAMMQAARAAQGDGAAEYLVFGDERWTYDNFSTEANRMAHALAEMGIGKGDRVAIALRNCPELLILCMAISGLGAVVVFLNAWWTTEELDYALTDSAARLVFADAERLRRLEPLAGPRSLTLIGVRDGIMPLSYSSMLAASTDTSGPAREIKAEDDFAIMYSSGTTGHPKGVVLTHRGAVNAVYTWLMQAVMAPLITPPDADAPPAPRPSVLVVTPLFHVTATHPMFLLSMPAGAKLVLMAKWDAMAAVNLIRDEGITRFLGVPTQSADLMAAARAMGETLPSLDYLGSGGAKRPAAQVADLAATFPNANIATGWGMTETNAIGIGMAGMEYVDRPGSAGRLYPPLQELKFLDDAGNEVAQGMVGEITVKSPCNMREYLNQPEATAAVLQDGWLKTGDLGMIDADGYVSIVDRKKNIIIRGGENIACLDVEGALHRHPDVAEACVFAVPDARLGEVVGAGIQLRNGATTSAETLAEFLAGHIAAFKIPAHFWLRDQPLPRGATDKIDRRALRDECLKTLTERTI